MACALTSHEVSDLTLGKPALFWLPLSAPVSDALSALKLRDDSEISVWACVPGTHQLCRSSSSSSSSGSSSRSSSVEALDSAVEGAIQGADAWNRLRTGECLCVGKVCMQNIICYLATDESLNNPAKALQAPLSVLLGEGQRTVQHIDSDASLLEALDLIVWGAQNLVVGIDSHINKYIRRPIVSSKALFPQNSMPSTHSLLPKNHNGKEYCWLTQEDVLRFLLGSIGNFSPLPMMSIEDLGIINTDVLMVGVEKEAITALQMIEQACLEMTAVAVVDDDGEHGAKLVGEISCSTLQACDETAALALATLSVGDFLVYTQDCKCPPDALVETVRSRLYEKVAFMKGDELQQQQPNSKLGEAHQIFQFLDLEMWEESSDDECGAYSPTGPQDLSRRWFSGHHRSNKAGYGARSRIGPIVCRPWSSLIAVIMQALAHRESYVWVTNEDDTLVGIVSFLDILTVLRNHLNPMS